MAIVQVDELIRKAQELSPLPTSVIQLVNLTRDRFKAVSARYDTM